MLYDLVTLTWFDTITVAVTFLSFLLIQLISAKLANTSATAISTTSDTTTTTNTTDETAPTNGRIQKQKSEQCEDLPLLREPSSPPASARNSIHSLSNGCSSHTLPHRDSFSDEYHEDEDTLSLENLFPCDQSEIYASKKISFIIDELIQTEANYVNNLQKGLKNYGKLQEEKHKELPEALQGEQGRAQLLGNIEEILALHERQVWPMMLRNQRDLKKLFDDFAALFDKNHLYCYVIFMMHKKTSMQLRREHRDWLQNYQTEINDKLGIDSFLVQPIQRLTRYPLLLQQFISEFYKSSISCKPVLMSVCKLETRMRRLLEVVNQAEEIPSIDEINGLNLMELGNFRQATEFDAYHHRSRKKYRAKVFLFERCLVCAEMRKKGLAYRQHYDWDLVELKLVTSKSISLMMKDGKTKEEYDFSTAEAKAARQWLRVALQVMERNRIYGTQSGKFSLPMDLVLGFAAAVWLIWQYF